MSSRFEPSTIPCSNMEFFGMKTGYAKFAFLVLSVIFLANEAFGNWNYNDVDLRIAERKVIPHYRRHSYEYADIDIKKIMQQRGIPVPSQNQRPVQVPTNHYRQTHYTQQRNTVNNGAWRNRGKSVAISNHVLPHRDLYFKKKAKYYRNFQVDNKAKLKRFY